MYDKVHSVPERIVSVSQPFSRPIVHDKMGNPVESGTKLDISVVNGWTRLECCSFDAHNEAGNLQMIAEHFRERKGHYPARILADEIYRDRENWRIANSTASGFQTGARQAEEEFRCGQETGLSG
jgi:hypothetical protein